MLEKGCSNQHYTKWSRAHCCPVPYMAQTFPAELKLRPVYWPRCASYVREIRGRQTFIAIRLCTVWSLFRLRHSGRFAPTDCFGTILVSFPDAPNDDVGDQTHDRGNDQRHQELAHGCGLLITEQRKPVLYVSLCGYWSDVRYWHLADIDLCAAHVCF